MSGEGNQPSSKKGSSAHEVRVWRPGSTYSIASIHPRKLCSDPSKMRSINMVLWTMEPLTRLSGWLAKNELELFLSLSLFYNLESLATFYWDDSIFLGWNFTVLASCQRSMGFINFGKNSGKSKFYLPSSIIFSYQARRISLSGVTKHIYLCRRSFYPFLDRMLAPHLKLGGNATCYHFSTPFLPTLN